MINGNFFEISFAEVISSPLGTILGNEGYTVNYYKDYVDRETMCCNCDKKGPGPDQTV